MNKLVLSASVARMTVLSSLIANIGFGFFLSPLIAKEISGPEKDYRSCAELQKHLNDNNPGKKYQGFEKARLVRREIDDDQYIIFCNGGILTNAHIGTVCRGYIAYSYARVVATARYYSRWGKTRGLPNDNDTGMENYCRWLK